MKKFPTFLQMFSTVLIKTSMWFSLKLNKQILKFILKDKQPR